MATPFIFTDIDSNKYKIAPDGSELNSSEAEAIFSDDATENAKLSGYEDIYAYLEENEKRLTQIKKQKEEKNTLQKTMEEDAKEAKAATSKGNLMSFGEGVAVGVSTPLRWGASFIKDFGASVTNLTSQTMDYVQGNPTPKHLKFSEEQSQQLDNWMTKWGLRSGAIMESKDKEITPTVVNFADSLGKGIAEFMSVYGALKTVDTAVTSIKTARPAVATLKNIYRNLPKSIRSILVDGSATMMVLDDVGKPAFFPQMVKTFMGQPEGTLKNALSVLEREQETNPVLSKLKGFAGGVPMNAVFLYAGKALTGSIGALRTALSAKQSGLNQDTLEKALKDLPPVTKSDPAAELKVYTDGLSSAKEMYVKGDPEGASKLLQEQLWVLTQNEPNLTPEMTTVLKEMRTLNEAAFTKMGKDVAPPKQVAPKDLSTKRGPLIPQQPTTEVVEQAGKPLDLSEEAIKKTKQMLETEAILREEERRVMSTPRTPEVTSPVSMPTKINEALRNTTLSPQEKEQIITPILRFYEGMSLKNLSKETRDAIEAGYKWLEDATSPTPKKSLQEESLEVRQKIQDKELSTNPQGELPSVDTTLNIRSQQSAALRQELQEGFGGTDDTAPKTPLGVINKHIENLTENQGEAAIGGFSGQRPQPEIQRRRALLAALKEPKTDEQVAESIVTALDTPKETPAIKSPVPMKEPEGTVPIVPVSEAVDNFRGWISELKNLVSKARTPRIEQEDKDNLKANLVVIMEKVEDAITMTNPKELKKTEESVMGLVSQVDADLADRGRQANREVIGEALDSIRGVFASLKGNIGSRRSKRGTSSLPAVSAPLASFLGGISGGTGTMITQVDINQDGLVDWSDYYLGAAAGAVTAAGINFGGHWLFSGRTPKMTSQAKTLLDHINTTGSTVDTMRRHFNLTLKGEDLKRSLEICDEVSGLLKNLGEGKIKDTEKFLETTRGYINSSQRDLSMSRLETSIVNNQSNIEKAAKGDSLVESHKIAHSMVDTPDSLKKLLESLHSVYLSVGKDPNKESEVLGAIKVFGIENTQANLRRITPDGYSTNGYLLSILDIAKSLTNRNKRIASQEERSVADIAEFSENLYRLKILQAQASRSPLDGENAVRLLRETNLKSASTLAVDYSDPTIKDYQQNLMNYWKDNVSSWRDALESATGATEGSALKVIREFFVHSLLGPTSVVASLFQNTITLAGELGAKTIGGGLQSIVNNDRSYVAEVFESLVISMSNFMDLRYGKSPWREAGEYWATGVSETKTKYGALGHFDEYVNQGGNRAFGLGSKGLLGIIEDTNSFLSTHVGIPRAMGSADLAFVISHGRGLYRQKVWENFRQQKQFVNIKDFEDYLNSSGKAVDLKKEAFNEAEVVFGTRAGEKTIAKEFEQAVSRSGMLGDIFQAIVVFSKVPMRLLGRALRFDPLTNLLSGVARGKSEQRQWITEFLSPNVNMGQFLENPKNRELTAKTIMGSGVYLLGMGFASAGMLSGSNAYAGNTNKKPYTLSFDVNGYRVDFNYGKHPILKHTLGKVADLYDLVNQRFAIADPEKKKDIFERCVNLLGYLVGTTSEEAFGDTQELLGYIMPSGRSYDPNKFASELAKRFIPAGSLMRDTNILMGNPKEITKDDTLWDSMLNTFAADFPIKVLSKLRDNPIDSNLLGEPRAYKGFQKLTTAPTVISSSLQDEMEQYAETLDVDLSDYERTRYIEDNKIRLTRDEAEYATRQTADHIIKHWPKVKGYLDGIASTKAKQKRLKDFLNKAVSTGKNKVKVSDKFTLRDRILQYKKGENQNVPQETP